MRQQEHFINSVNLNAQTEFPFLMLKVENGTSYPMNPGFRVMHWHEDLQFIYVLEGSVCVKTLDREEIISSGEGVYINKNVVHLVEAVTDSKYRSFLFPEHFVSFYPVAPAVRLTKRITENQGISLIVLYSEKPWCQEALVLLRELARLDAGTSDGYVYEILNTLTSLWFLMIKNVSLPKASPESVTVSRTKKLLEYIEGHYAEEVTLEAMAKSASISKSEALRCFRSALQTTPYRYLMDYRLQIAANLLKETKLPISEIAVMTGFNQQSYFGKCFREKMGCSPSDYRKGQPYEQMKI